ncbi:sugar ABC transporter permease [Catellatospora methionotrophica]|uniref:Sugar ABC transporter permease n=1 Tax=Catellatospora methionotrophica TaxID=121620 RepID=A0A8J3PGY1_9ACTN|nr:sugar ABC transporter permease [Catellatospora methionotrophica]GIG14801.1 sugar ABC transporter permease [Catellatospora methionotrophica]
MTALDSRVAAPADPAPDGAPPHGRRRPARHGRDNRTAYLMIAPMVVLLAVFVMWPLVYSLYLSTFKISFYTEPEFVGLDFYQYVLESPRFWESIWVGLYYAVLTVPTGIVIALLLASFIKTLSRRAASYMKTTVYLPAVVSTVVASVLFVFMYQDDGVVNAMLGVLNHGPVNWLNDPSYALPAIAVPGIWLSFGVTTLILLAGLLDIPENYYESAQLDGAGFFQRLFRITIPLLKNVLLYLLVTGFTLAIQLFELPLIMTNGGPVDATMTPNLYIFASFRDLTPYATSFSLTASLMLFAVLGAISLVIFRLVNSDKAIDG